MIKNVVLIVLDTQRADHLSCYGYDRQTSPFIDSLAKRGVLFERCYAPNIPTHPSFTTMLSGVEAITHNILNIGGKFPMTPGVPLIAEILQEQGISTAAVDNMGRHFPRGFDTYQTFSWSRENPTVLRKAEAVNEAAKPVIGSLVEGDKPFFLFMHFWDPHTPYLPPSPYNRKFYPSNRDPYDVNNHSMDPVWEFEPFAWYFHSWMPGVTDSDYVIAQYDGEIAYLDRQLRNTFAMLGPALDDTVVIITADHGEIMMEQEGYFDHHGLYEGNIHIPLIFFSPNHLPRGKRVPGFVQNVDITPTILDLLGVQSRTRLEGKSLLPCIFGLRDGNYDEVYLSEATWEVKRAVRTDRWKYINSLEQDFHGRPMQELYDLQADPQEQNNVIEQQSEVANELRGKLDAYVARRLQETGREIDPAKEQGVSGTRIGTPQPGEKLGAGATPLHKRKKQKAAAQPAPDALNAPKKA